MLVNNIAFIKSKNALLTIKYKETSVIGMENPKIIERRFIFLFSKSKFAIKQKTKKADKSKIATILRRKANPKITPAIKNLFLFITSKDEAIIGNNIKFSAFAIFPSNIGKPNKIVKIAVDI